MSTNVIAVVLIATAKLNGIHDAHPWLKKHGVETAFAMAHVESGCRNLPPYQDGKTKAWGLFAYHRARWDELSDRGDWGRATPERQVELHLRWMNYTVRRAEQKGQPYLRTICAVHNGYGTPRQRAMYLGRIQRAIAKPNHGETK